MTALKVGVWGLVKSVSDSSFVVNDGSEDLKIVIDPSITLTTWPTVGDYVAVVGIATLENPTTRIIKPWREDNILIIMDVP